MAKGIYVELTEEQQEQIKPLMNKIATLAENGTPGMVVAQIYKDHMAVGYFNHEQGKAIQKTIANMTGKKILGNATSWFTRST